MSGEEAARQQAVARPPDARPADAARRAPQPGVPRADLRRAPAPGGDAGTIDLREVLAVLYRRLPVILGTVVLATVIAAVYAAQLAPRFSTEAWLMLDTRHVRVGIPDVMSGVDIDGSVVRSEMDILSSYPLAKKAAEALHLEKEPEFNPNLRAPEAAESMRHPVQYILSALRRFTLGSHPRSAPATPDLDRLTNGMIGALMGHVSVSNDGRSYLLRIHAQAGSAELAARIANAYVDAYLLDQLELKYNTIRRTSDWLNEHLTQLREKVEESENAVQLFRQQHDMVATAAGTVTAQQLTELNTQLVMAATERSQKEANLKALQEEGPSSDAVSSVAAQRSPMLQKLREEQSQLLRRQAELATRYKPAHPAMVNLSAELADVARKIKDEMHSAAAALSSDVAMARAREAALRTTLAGIERSSEQQDKAGIQLRELEREAAANKVLYENFLTKFKQTTTQEDLQQPDARLVAPAIPPGGPSYPNRSALIMMTAAVSLAVGVGIAFVLEHLDNCFRSGEQVEREVGVRALGMVPTVGGGTVAHKLVMEQPTALYSEAVRALRTALRYTNVDRPPKLILVTSSLPSEGKTVLALSLARSVARSGGKALLVDCDLRRPSVGRLTRCGGERNLLDLFDGAEPETLIARDSESSVDVIAAKAGTANPQDVLGSQRMQAFLAAMRERYDLIVLDAPPILVVSDPIVLCHLVDATLFLIRWEKSARKSVRQGLQLLQADGGSVTGAVITRVNARRHARYYYRDSAYYNYYRQYDESKAPAGA